jgi:hypothetical protein
MSQQGQRSVRLQGPVSGGKGWPFGSPQLVERFGCVIEEFLLEGVANSYEPVSGTQIARDGNWDVQPSASAEFRTRLYVVRPAEASRFNGVVLVNWQNVTAGLDLGSPSAYEMANGYAWFGVTTQRVAIDGQPSLAPGMPSTKGLPAADPERYGTLHHPGDEYSYDIFTSAARAVGRDRVRDGVDPLAGLEPRLVIATGASQSAMRLGSYINLVDDREPFFDGFFLNVHWGICPYPPNQPLVESFAPVVDGFYAGSSAIKQSGRVPIFVLNTQSETLHNLPVRQADSPTFRFWEMAGTAHAGGGSASAEMQEILARDGMMPFLQREVANRIDWSWVRNAALEYMVRWSDGGAPPPSFPPIDASAQTGIHVDADGNATGGIRLPELEVPTARHSGTNSVSPLAALTGESVPFDTSEIHRRYASAADYLEKWDAAVDRAREQGLLLDADVDTVRRCGRDLADELWT